MTPGQVQTQLSFKTRDLACGRGETVLVRAVTLDLARGQGLLLRGPNGAGKSTLLLTLAGLLPPLEGKIELIGHDPENGPALHYCGHRNGIRPRLGVLETLSFWAAIHGPFGLSPAAALEQVGLAGAARLDAGYLSAGQQRRLALARLLVSPRPVWLLDEPTAALDASGHRLIADLLRAHLADGGIAIVATHDDIAAPGFATLTLGAAS